MNKTILTDCDGVLLDWEKTFHDWMQSQGYKLHNAGVYEMDVAYGIPRSECKRLVRVFNESAWMGFLPALRDARSGVARLVEAGYTFVCITSLSLDEKARLLRISNLKNIFGKNVFDDVICLDTGADKDDELVKYQDSELYWIEDKTENAECGLKYGLKPIIITHEHNKDCNNPDIARCDDWVEIANTILGE
jgi:hypothetical protein